MFWWLSIDRVALFLFTVGTLCLNGKNHLRILGAFLLLSFLYKYFINKFDFGKDKPPSELISYTAWVIWAGITGLFVSVSFFVFKQSFITLINTTLMIWLCYGLLRMNQAYRTVFWGIICGCLVQMIALKLNISFVKYVGVVQGEEIIGEGRVAALTGNANSLGFIMVGGSTAAMLLWNTGKSAFQLLKKMFLLAFMVAAVYVTFQTGSRKTTAAIIVLVVGWLTFTLSYGHVMLNMIIRIAIVIGLLVASGWGLMYVLENTVVGKRFAELTQRGSGSIVMGVEEDVRADMYRAGFDMFKQNPIFGVGFAQYQVYYWKGAYSHSDYIEPLACTGLVGFFLYHGFNFFLLKRLLWLRRTTRSNHIRYTVNVMLLAMVVHLLLGLGVPYWSIQREWVILTTFATFAWMAEKRIRLGLNETETMVIGGPQPIFKPIPVPRNI